MPEGQPSSINDRETQRRSRLACERTQLAWWRTGLTSLAVALAVGKLVPDLGTVNDEVPYTVLGAAFAIYGVFLFAYGTLMAREVDGVIGEGRRRAPRKWMIQTLTAIGMILAIATAGLISFG